MLGDMAAFDEIQNSANEAKIVGVLNQLLEYGVGKKYLAGSWRMRGTPH